MINLTAYNNIVIMDVFLWAQLCNTFMYPLYSFSCTFWQ